jgi:hypothetical protein
LTEAGKYTNDATVTGETIGGVPLTKTSNEVVVEVPREVGFTIEKRQQIAGSGAGFTTALLTGEIKQTVDYLITVTNTGNMPLLLSGFTDAHCDEGTISGGPGAVPLAPGASTTYMCDHVLTSAGSYLNEASVTATAPGDPPVSVRSNVVEVDVPEKPAKIVGPPPPPPKIVVSPEKCAHSVLRGASGPQRKAFTVQIGSAGITQITFFLDGRRLKTLKQTQARGGKFTVKIDPRKLAYGAHRVTYAAIMSNPNCASAASPSVFVRPAPPQPPKITG